MKVLIVTNDFPPKVGGINHYVDQIARRLPAGGVVVLAPAHRGSRAFDRTFPHPVVRYAGRMPVPTPAIRRGIEELVRAEDVDVVLFGASMPLALMGPGILRRTGTPYAGFTHGVEITAARAPGGGAALARIARHALFLTAVSRWTMGVLRTKVGSSPRLELLPAGIDPDRFHPDVLDDAVRHEHGLDADPVIACVSRLVARKGQNQLIRAMPRILGELPRARLLIVGSGPFERRLREMASHSPARDSIVFTGQVPYEDLASYFRAGDVFAMPCRDRWLGLEVEALGGVFLQASAVGRPNVAGDTGGVPDAVKDGETGLLVDGRDVAAVAEAVLALLLDPARAARMGRTGAAWVHKELTWDAIAGRLWSTLTDALASSAPAGRDGRTSRTG
jgi:phosphatidylinositol alpha-1,6-mannosyltransferase